MTTSQWSSCTNHHAKDYQLQGPVSVNYKAEKTHPALPAAFRSAAASIQILHRHIQVGLFGEGLPRNGRNAQNRFAVTKRSATKHGYAKRVIGRRGPIGGSIKSRADPMYRYGSLVKIYFPSDVRVWFGARYLRVEIHVWAGTIAISGRIPSVLED